MTLKVLDLFSGLNGWGAAFRDRGHHVVSLDLEAKFGALDRHPNQRQVVYEVPRRVALGGVGYEREKARTDGKV